MKNIFKPFIKFFYGVLPIGIRIKISYFRVYKKWPNISKPNTFNEKILCRIIFDKNKIYPILADKYLVRDFIKKYIGEDVLIPLILVTSRPIDLLDIKDWTKIVIKPNHGAGMVKIFDENPNLEVKNETIHIANSWLKSDFSKVCDEWHYSKIKPLLLVEKKITQKNEIPRDYKFHCFKQKDGTLKYVLQVVDGRFGQESRGYYVNSLDNCIWYHGFGRHHLSVNEKYSLEIILEYNRVIMNSDAFDYIRIDWYIIDKKIYFGELTFTPGAGRSNEFGKDLEKIMLEYWVE